MSIDEIVFLNGLDTKLKELKQSRPIVATMRPLTGPQNPENLGFLDVFHEISKWKIDLVNKC